MRKNTTIKFPKYLLFLFFFTQLCVGQLSNFTLTVTHANETCTANGSLTFTTSGTTPGASMLYSIYLLPNTTTPITTTANGTFGGLVAGNYTVVATQSLGGQSGSQQQNVTITYQIVNLTYQLTGVNSVGCINNGQIIVGVTSGTAVGYEIFSGPIIKPLQTSNVFTGLSGGVYQVRVFDACGEGVVQTFTLLSLPASLQLSGSIAGPPTNCSTAGLSHFISSVSGSLIAYPLNVVITVFPPSGGPIVYNQTITSGNPTSLNLTQNIPLYPNQNYSYSITVTDACGNIRTLNANPVNSTISVAATGVATLVNCVPIGSISISVIQTAVMVSAPAAFTVALPHNYTSDIASGSLVISNLPLGTYTFNVTDVCGNPRVIQVTINPPSTAVPTFVVKEGCDENTGSVHINNSSGTITSIMLVQAPSTYTAPLPQNVTGFVYPGNHSFSMNDLPLGNYRFHIVASCGNQFDVNVTITGYHVNTNTYAVTEHCGSFDLEMHYSSNNESNATYWLQKYNPITNQWGHPGTGTPYVFGTPLTNLNGIFLTNNGLNINLAYTGTFRIITNFSTFGNGSTFSECYKVLNQFVFDGTPKIIDVYSFLCSNNTFQAVVNATGLGPLVYRITTKNGLPFIIQNGTSNIFLGLQPAIYNFQVEDVCGNILNSLHDISDPLGFPITPSNFCNGQTASLSVPNFPFLTYQWWEASAPTVILSTTSQLLFPNFNGANDNGTYFVSIVHLINATCINQTQSYVVNAVQSNPNAGANAAISYCGSQNLINLFSLMSGNFDLNGTWSTVSPAGSLSGSIWNATGVLPGIYQFKYTVTGFCNLSDEAIVSITIKAIPQTPIATSTAVICESQSLQLFATTIPNVTYQWSGPNNFSSNLQNPTINAALIANSGTYTVQVSENGCPSGSTSVTVKVVPLPHAGSNGTIAYCGSQGAIDLFTLLNGTYDANGVWSALATGGTLTNNVWDSTGVAPGVYPFRYTVAAPSCNSSVNAVVTITIKPIPQTPIASVNPVVCDSQSLQLFATTIPNATYQWSGPNGFVSNVQNPIINPVSTINNGVYTVHSIQNGCSSPLSSVAVQVRALPEFTIQFNCDNNQAVLLATPIQNSFDGTTANYQWSNADGFSSTDNPVTITGEAPGMYTLTITNVDGCPNTNTINVPATLCSIPQGISPNNDGLNETFDLSGFSGVTTVKIFNRYGMVVFEQDNYVKEWYGQDKKGNLLPSATYFYLVNMENDEPRTGWVYLLRENN